MRRMGNTREASGIGLYGVAASGNVGELLVPHCFAWPHTHLISVGDKVGEGESNPFPGVDT